MGAFSSKGALGNGLNGLGLGPALVKFVMYKYGSRRSSKGFGEWNTNYLYQFLCSVLYYTNHNLSYKRGQDIDTFYESNSGGDDRCS